MAQSNTPEMPEDNTPGTPPTNTPGTSRASDWSYGMEELSNPRKTRDPYLQGRRDALRELYESGGVGSMQMGLEVLYLLPDTFVKFYQDLFHRALVVESGAVSGKGDAIDKAKGTTGTVLGSETRAQAQGTGKRWKNPKGSVRSQRAFDVKAQIDKELTRLAAIGLRSLKETNRTGAKEQGTKRCSGLRKTYIDRSEVPGWTRPKCGMFLSDGWDYCPRCGTRVE